MRANNTNAVGYAPAPIPSTADELPSFLNDELQRISAAITALALGHLDISYAYPTKPRAGDIRYFDGTTINPGSGAGIYRYTGSAWAFVG